MTGTTKLCAESHLCLVLGLTESPLYSRIRCCTSFVTPSTPLSMKYSTYCNRETGFASVSVTVTDNDEGVVLDSFSYQIQGFSDHQCETVRQPWEEMSEGGAEKNVGWSKLSNLFVLWYRVLRQREKEEGEGEKCHFHPAPLISHSSSSCRDRTICVTSKRDKIDTLFQLFLPLPHFH